MQTVQPVDQLITALIAYAAGGCLAACLYAPSRSVRIYAGAFALVLGGMMIFRLINGQ